MADEKETKVTTEVVIKPTSAAMCTLVECMSEAFSNGSIGSFVTVAQGMSDGSTRERTAFIMIKPARMQVITGLDSLEEKSIADQEAALILALEGKVVNFVGFRSVRPGQVKYESKGIEYPNTGTETLYSAKSVRV